MPFASRSVKQHYVRGAVGLIVAVTAFVGAAVWSPAALVLLLVTVAAWRGCPTCWAIGLMQTRQCELSRGAGGPRPPRSGPAAPPSAGGS